MVFVTEILLDGPPSLVLYLSLDVVVWCTAGEGDVSR